MKSNDTPVRTLVELHELTRETDPKRWKQQTIAALIHSARKRARDFNLEFSIGVKDIDLVEICPILQVKMVRHSNVYGRDSFTLDRVDPLKGYVPGNVRVISWQANRLKENLTLEQVERLVKYMKGEI